MPSYARVLNVITLLLVLLSTSAAASFDEISLSAGLDFVHDNGNSGELWTLEIVGAGVAVLDFDNDGRLDVWLVQGGPLANRSGNLPGDRLFRNVSMGHQLKFEDVTDASGVVATEYGMGIATGDIDNDGDLDVFLANFGSNQLFENIGSSRFVDITRTSGIAGERWSVAASFVDVDGDSLLDLYVVNYLDFSGGDHKPCRQFSSRLTYCAPRNYAPVSDRLYKNLGQLRFKDISARAGITKVPRRGMGVVARDFSGDGKPDIYVTNDAEENFLWINQGNGRFKDDALMAGAAVNVYGIAEASMGVVAADFDRDGDMDIFITHDTRESNTLYVNDGKGWFEDHSSLAGLATSSLAFTGFGTGWIDLDNDGDLDLFSANGAVRIIERQRAAGIEPPLRQRNQLWLNDGSRYRSIDAGASFAHQDVSRGTAFGDLDNDGYMDFIVTNNNGPARLYRNESSTFHWLGIELADNRGPPQANHALVWRETSRAEVKQIGTDGGYASAHDHRILFGLHNKDTPQFVRVRWPDGSEQRFGPLKVDRYHHLTRESIRPRLPGEGR